MAVPDYQTLMLPLLKRLAQQDKPASVRSFLDSVADEFGLTEEERAERIPSGGENLLLNRLAWARTYMGKAGLLGSPRHGLIEISQRGRDVLNANPATIDVAFLKQFQEFKDWQARSQNPSATESPKVAQASSEASASTIEEEQHTPRERIDAAKSEIETALREDLIQRIQAMTPADFEELILRLLLNMGYGQGLDEMARALGGSSDGGMDGVVHQDPLGLERVYVQAKRWKGTNKVGPHEIRDFVGALNIHRANKGVFVTASNFTNEATKAAENSTVQVVLIDGVRLAELMVKYKVGVVVRDVIEIKAVDEGFFDE